MRPDHPGAHSRSAPTTTPAGGRLTRLRRGRLSLDVRDGGPLDGPVVVLLHGFPQDGSSWDLVLPELHEAGLRTLVPDQRGYSPGSRTSRRAAYRMEHLVDDTLALLDAAGVGRAHLVGHDWGGGVAWATAFGAPDRTASLTVVSTPHPRAMLRSLVSSGQALRSWYMGFFQLPRLPEAMVLPVLEGGLRRSGLPAPFATRYARRMREPGALTSAMTWYRAIPLSRTRAGDISVPTTFLWGTRDFALGPRAAHLTEDHVRAPYRFRAVAAGHWLPETHPGLVAEAVVAQAATP